MFKVGQRLNRFYSRHARSEVAEILSKYESTAQRPLNLSQLLSFGRPVSPDSVLSSVSYVLYELPRRLATRVRFLESLPFIVGTNPYVAKTLEAFRDSFLLLATHPPVTNLQENQQFVKILSDLVQRHANDIPTMAKGFQECSRYIGPTEVSAFLDGAIRNRISVRLIAEQHIAVTHALYNPPQDGKGVGVIDTKCSPKQMIDMCGSFVTELCEATLGSSPRIVINGHPEATFAYIPVHLEYILTEILKNSFRATVEHHGRQKKGPTSESNIPPIVITLSPPPTPSLASSKNNYFSIRIRDQGGGVSPQNMERIFSYAFTTAGNSPSTEWGNDPSDLTVDADGECESTPFLGVMTKRTLQTGIGTIAGLGYGLPMSQLYARYFGGSLDLMSLEGWGCDVFIKLRCLDEAGDSSI